MARKKQKTEIEKPVWLKTDKKEIEAIIVKLAKKGLTSEKIGLILRDQYGIPKAKITGDKISTILKDNNLYKDSNIYNLEKKEEELKKHIEKNNQDKKSKRALTIINARIRKLKKYNNKKSEKN